MADPKKNVTNKRSRSVRTLIALSLLISGSILVLSFTRPFRQPGRPLVSAAVEPEQLTPERLDLADQIRRRRENADGFLAAAKQLDAQFMRMVAERSVTPIVPGKQEVKAKFDQHAQKVRKTLNELKNAQEGSLEYAHQQELLESLADGPQ